MRRRRSSTSRSTVTRPSKSFLTVWPAGTPRPFASADNAEPGLVMPNLTLAKLGPTGGISIYAQQGAINLAIDLVGYTCPCPMLPLLRVRC